MRIALCTRRFVPPFIGGVDVYTDRLRRALLRLGCEVFVIAFDSSVRDDGEGFTVTRESYKQTPVRRVAFSFADRPKEAFDHAYDPEMGQITRQVLLEERPDVVIFLNFYTITLAGVEAAKSLQIPVGHIATDFIPVCRRGTLIRWHGRSCEVGESVKNCATCFVSHRTLGRVAASLLNQLPERMLAGLAQNHEDYSGLHPLRPLNFYWRHVSTMTRRLEILQSLRRQIDFVMAPTQYTVRMFKENGFKSDQVHFVPFAVDVNDQLSQIEHTPSEHIRFLFIGRFQPYKGAHLLVRAFNGLTSPRGATLTIYGAPDKNYQNHYQELKSLIDANDRVNFKGIIPPEQLAQAFAEADFFVLPSTWHENSPLILLSALQSKTSVIASDIEGVKDIVHDGVNGLLFPMGDVIALRQVLQRTIDEPDLKSKLQPGANLFSIDEYGAKLIELCRAHLQPVTLGWSEQA